MCGPNSWASSLGIPEGIRTAVSPSSSACIAHVPTSAFLTLRLVKVIHGTQHGLLNTSLTHDSPRTRNAAIRRPLRASAPGRQLTVPAKDPVHTHAHSSPAWEHVPTFSVVHGVIARIDNFDELELALQCSNRCRAWRDHGGEASACCIWPTGRMCGCRSSAPIRDAARLLPASDLTSEEIRSTTERWNATRPECLQRSIARRVHQKLQARQARRGGTPTHRSDGRLCTRRVRQADCLLRRGCRRVGHIDHSASSGSHVAAAYWQ